MPKRASGPLPSLPPRKPGTPAYRWLYEVLRGDILAGRLRPGARLPATRELAARAAVARGTVVAAFEQLVAEGYAEGSVGSGTYVSRVLPEELLEAGRPAGRAVAESDRRRRLSGLARRARLFTGFDERPTRAFRLHLPAVDLFPTTLWAQVASRHWRRATASQLTRCDPLGYRPLREALTDYLAISRGVRTAWQQVMITSGSQEALDLAARVLVDPGDRVAIEDPGYTGAWRVFEAAGAKLVTLPVDHQGATLAGRALAGTRLVYTTPAHQFPLGVTMTLARRLELLDWARRAGGLVFEDDYDSEYRYSGRPVPALQGLDEAGTVLFAGSFNKVLFPSLRLGYLVLPDDLVEPFTVVKSLNNRHAQLLEQVIVCEWITAGHFGRHLRRMREVYAERLSILLDEGRKRLGERLELSAIEAGLQTTGRLLGGLEGAEVERLAAAREVEVSSLHHSARRRLPYEGLQLGFAAVDPRELRRGVRELAAVLDGLERAANGAGG
jgi:GntR family transcriptional regulator/MocR family aminotransferase